MAMSWYIGHTTRGYGVIVFGPLRAFTHAARVARGMGAAPDGRLPHLTTNRARAPR